MEPAEANANILAVNTALDKVASSALQSHLLVQNLENKLSRRVKRELAKNAAPFIATNTSATEKEEMGPSSRAEKKTCNTADSQARKANNANHKTLRMKTPKGTCASKLQHAADLSTELRHAAGLSTELQHAADLGLATKRQHAPQIYLPSCSTQQVYLLSCSTHQTGLPSCSMQQTCLPSCSTHQVYLPSCSTQQTWLPSCSTPQIYLPSCGTQQVYLLSCSMHQACLPSCSTQQSCLCIPSCIGETPRHGCNPWKRA
jgi:hypothetical protein